MMYGRNDIKRACSALFSLDPGCHRAEWVCIGMAAKDAGVPFDDFNAWSEPAPNYKGEADCRSVWNSFDDGAITAATLFKLARDAGWQDIERAHQNGHHAARAPLPRLERDTKPAQKPRIDFAAMFEHYPPADASHPYIVAKHGAAGGLRVVPADDPLKIQGVPVAGWLAVPVRTLGGQLQTVQYIPPPGAGKKLNGPGASFGAGLFVVGEIDTCGRVYVCEGIGTAWAVARADYYAAAAVAFGAGRFRVVALALRERYPQVSIIFMPDRGKEPEVETVAREVCGAWVEMPADKPANYDANDYEAESDTDTLAALLRTAKTPDVEYRLRVTFADELPEVFTPPDELVQDVLTTDGGSVLYGEPTAGKTYLVIDIAAAVARGIPWMGKQTEPGLVIYLAAESPASVCRRLQAYQMHHGVRVPNFAIVQSPIDLFDGEADTEAVICLVRELEVQCGQRARLIVGDTLARLSAGANENAGQDMGLVIRRFDRIRSQCNAHFMLIHHSGKNAAAGSRGWSGVRGAVDTEIEITDLPSGRCAQITKQRDLCTKGERIGFRLEAVELGRTKWGAPAMSCVVVPADAPDRPKGKRMGETEGAVAEFLATHKVGIKKKAVVAHFAGRHASSSVYRAMKTLVEAGVIHEAAGMVCIASASAE